MWLARRLSTLKSPTGAETFMRNGTPTSTTAAGDANAQSAGGDAQVKVQKRRSGRGGFKRHGSSSGSSSSSGGSTRSGASGKSGTGSGHFDNGEPLDASLALPAPIAMPRRLYRRAKTSLVSQPRVYDKSSVVLCQCYPISAFLV